MMNAIPQLPFQGMLVAGNTKLTDVLCVTRPSIPQGAHAMTQLVELLPVDAGLGPHRHSGPVFGTFEPSEIASGDSVRHPSARRHAE